MVLCVLTLIHFLLTQAEAQPVNKLPVNAQNASKPQVLSSRYFLAQCILVPCDAAQPTACNAKQRNASMVVVRSLEIL